MSDLYSIRFSGPEERAKDASWIEIVRYLQRWIDESRPVMDIACDRGYFIRHVRGLELWGCDLRAQDLGPDVHFLQASGLDLLDHVPKDHFGTVFLSNYLEHLATSEQVVEQLRIAAKLLAPGGRVMVLQPNIRFAGPAYWDFIDHHVPLTERSLVEAGELAGLTTERVVTQFLPYTTKGRLPTRPGLVRLYLQVPIVWRLFGAQTLFIGRDPRPVS